MIGNKNLPPKERFCWRYGLFHMLKIYQIKHANINALLSRLNAVPLLWLFLLLIYFLFVLDNQWGWQSHHLSRAPNTTDSPTRKTNVKPMFLNYKLHFPHRKSAPHTKTEGTRAWLSLSWHKLHPSALSSPDYQLHSLVRSILGAQNPSGIRKQIPSQRKSKHSVGNRQPPNVYLHPVFWALL